MNTDSKSKQTHNDIQETLNHINELSTFFQALEEYGRTIPEKYNMKPSELDQYIKNKKHFSEKEWHYMQEQKTELDQFINEMISVFDTTNKTQPKRLKDSWIPIN